MWSGKLTWIRSLAHGIHLPLSVSRYPAYVNLLATTLHSLDPVAIAIGPISVKWYGVSYATGFLVGWLILLWMAKTKRCLLQPEQVGDLLTWLVVGVIVGGRVGHVCFYEPSLLWKFTGTLPFWGLLEIHKGGMSSHGGMIGVLAASFLWARAHHIIAAHIFDLAAFGAPTGLMLGRLANWINGELWGKPISLASGETAPWWAVAYPEEVLSANYDLTKLEPLRGALDPSRTLADSVYVACYSGRMDIIEQVEPLLTPRWPVNFLQAFTDGPVLAAVLIAVWWKPRKSGTITGAFLVTYACARLLTEQVRMGDNASWDLGSFTAPMQLSALMGVFGIAILIVSARKPGPLLGGIGK